MKHTQGEWYASQPKISELADGQTYFSIQSKNPEKRGNSYVMPGFYYPHSIQTPEEMEANARIIASAPELLSALIILEKAYRDAVKLYDPNTHDAYSLLSHNAIAKAIT